MKHWGLKARVVNARRMIPVLTNILAPNLHKHIYTFNRPYFLDRKFPKIADHIVIEKQLEGQA